MSVLFLILFLLSAICFGCAAFNLVVDRRINFTALGLLFWVLVPLINTIRGL